MTDMLKNLDPRIKLAALVLANVGAYLQVIDSWDVLLTPSGFGGLLVSVVAVIAAGGMEAVRIGTPPQKTASA